MKDALERLSDKLLVGDGCWEWTAAKDRLKYGRVNSGERMVLAHRFVYELLAGPIPEGLELDHLCRNPSCVRPAHLEPVTRRENQMRGKTISARNASRTHCPYGHPYSGDNLYITPKGHRHCRACKDIKQRARRAQCPIAI